MKEVSKFGKDWAHEFLYLMHTREIERVCFSIDDHAKKKTQAVVGKNEWF